MKENTQKLKNNLNRWVTSESVSFKIYLCWAVFAVLLIVVFGIYPATKELLAKYQITVQMTKLNEDLLKKYNEVSDVSEKLELVATDIPYLDKNIPENFDLQNYMVDFITAVGEAGYYVDSFAPGWKTGPSVEIFANLSGNGDLVQLTQNIEGMDRVSEIQNIELKKLGTTDTLRLDLETYIMEKQ